MFWQKNARIVITTTLCCFYIRLNTLDAAHTGTPTLLKERTSNHRQNVMALVYLKTSLCVIDGLFIGPEEAY